jgi:DNA-binding CsgD family transcriptional regulator
MDTIDTLFGLLALAACAAGAVGALAANARQEHPRLKALAALFGYCALTLLSSAFSRAADGTGMLAMSGSYLSLPHLFSYSPFLYCLNAFNSLVGSQLFLYLFAKLACLAGGSDWKGFRALFYTALLAACEAFIAAGLILMPATGSIPAADILDAIKDYALTPLVAGGLVFAIVDLVRHIESCPWPGIKLLLGRTWPVFAALSLSGLLSLLLPWFSWSYAAACVAGAVLCVRESLRFLALDGGAKPAGKVSPEKMAAIGLTESEQEVCIFLLDGWTRAEISRVLKIASSAVNAQIKSTYSKAGATNKRELSRALR